MISQGHIVGLLNPEILLELEQNPDGEIAQTTSLCSALEIRYDWFENETEWPNLSSRIRSIFPDKLQIGTIRLVRDGGLFDNACATMRLKNWGQILTEEQKQDIQTLVEYMYEDEKKHYMECGYPKDHIFRVIKRLSKMIVKKRTRM